jgi:hypothetical protein
VDTTPENSPKSENPNLPLAMNRQQAEVFELLRGLSTERGKFHEWYQGAIQALNSLSSDKIPQAANSIRELCDKLPDRIADIPKFNSPVSPVKSLQRDFLEVKTSSYSGGWKSKTITKGLAKLLLRLEEIFKLCNEPPRKARFGMALTASDPQAELMSKERREARDETFDHIGSFFQEVTHHIRIVDESEFRKELELFEALLLNYLTPCTAAQQNELVSLIAGPPNPEALARVHELISYKGANYVFFFGKLDNPSWLQPLEQQGHFADLPQPEPISDGRLAYRIHFPLVALTTLAATAPQDVTCILIKLKLPNNSRVGDQIVQCISKIRDAGCIQQLRQLIAQLGENSTRTSWLWIQELLKSWMELKAFPEVLAILGAYVNSAVAKSVEREHDVSGTWLAKQVDEQTMEVLTPQHPFEVVRIIFVGLCRWMEQERQRYNKSEIGDDAPFSYFVEEFKSTPLEHRGIEAWLARRLFLAAQQIYVQGDLATIGRLDQLLRSNPWQLFRRLRWQLYANFPTHTLSYARAEVLHRIPCLNEIDYSRGSHDYEFAQLLIAHAKEHGNAFLSPNEVEQFVSVVMRGPVDHEGKLLEGNNDFFYRKQLWPIASLLRGEQLAAYRALVPDNSKITIESFKPFSSGGFSGGFVASEAPKEAGTLETMEDGELWNFLNTWEPKAGVEYDSEGKPHQENVFELAAKFAGLVQILPHRFNAATKWWENIQRAEILNKFLDLAADRISKKQNDGKLPLTSPTEDEWARWFGITEWVMAQPWPRHAAVRFLHYALKSDYAIPDRYFSALPNWLRQLIQGADPRLSGNNSFNDWLTTAINSIRGEGFEALLDLASRQKRTGRQIDPWIFEFINSRLRLPEESPSIFALLGANLNFLLYLFQQEFKETSSLLFPSDRPEHRSAAITAHFKYGQPWNVIIETFPTFIDDALDVLKAMQAEAKDEDAKQNRQDFGSQLGTHIACYYWSGSFATDAEGEAALDKFFSSASPGTRAALVSQIASIWERHAGEPPDQKVVGRVLRIWERRIAQIEERLKVDYSSSEFDAELAESIDWLGSEYFPFEWRFSHAKLALKRIKKAPQAYHLLKAITEYSALPERLESMLDLLKALLKKPSDDLQWSIQFKDLGPVILLGFASDKSSTKKLAEECKDLLLKMGFSDFLNLGGGTG